MHRRGGRHVLRSIAWHYVTFPRLPWGQDAVRAVPDRSTDAQGSWRVRLQQIL